MNTSKVLALVIGFAVIGIASIDEAYAGGNCCSSCTLTGKTVALSDYQGCITGVTYTFSQGTANKGDAGITADGTKNCTIDFPATTDASAGTGTFDGVAIASWSVKTATQWVFIIPATVAIPSNYASFDIVASNITNASAGTVDCDISIEGVTCDQTGILVSNYSYPLTACPPTCSDGILNQDEYCIDCGGTCASCGTCTELSAGDIAIIGMNASDPDEFTFVALTSIASGTTIKFTDKGWKSDDTWYSTEGILTWTATSAVSCGDEITIESGWTSTGGHTVVQTSGTFSLATIGDQIIAYQGPASSPYFIAALDNNGSIGWDADATSAQTSDIPTGLTNGTNCISVTPDVNVVYNCSTTSGAAAILGAVNTATNWTGSGSTITLPVPCSFTCGACVEPGTAPDAPTYASITTTTFDINWANGGPNYLVVVRSGSAVTADPVDNTTYTANTTFGSGSDIGTNEYVVYDGSGTTVSITGLTCGITYYVEIFSHDCAAGSEDYKIDVGGTSSQATSACPPGTCFDNIKNGTETGVDCGGGSCPNCDCD